MYCPVCGSEIESNVKFCPYCGEKVGNNGRDEAKKSSMPVAEEKQPVPQTIPRQPSPQMPQAIPADEKTTKTVDQPKELNKLKKKKKNRKSPVKAIVILLVILGSISLGLFLGAPTVALKKTENYSRTYVDDSTPLIFNFDIPAGKVIYAYNQTPTENVVGIKAQFDLVYKGYGVETLNDLYSISFEEDTSETNFFIEQETYFGASITDKTLITVTLRTDLSYELDVDLSSGNFEFQGDQNLTLDSLDAEVSSGNINVTLEPGSNILYRASLDTSSGNIYLKAERTTIGGSLELDSSSGNIQTKMVESIVNGNTYFDTSTGRFNLEAIGSTFQQGLGVDVSTGNVIMNMVESQISTKFEIEISTGRTDLTLENCTYPNETEFIFDGSTGDLNMEIYQGVDPLNDLNGTIDISTGEINLDFSGDGSVCSAKFAAKASTGDITLNQGEGFSKVDNTLIGAGFESLPHYDFFLESSTGDIVVNAET